MEEWLHPLLRALHYALLLGLFGLTAFRPIGLRGIERLPAAPGLTIIAVFAPLVSAALMLVGIASMMGQSLAALDRSVVTDMIVATGMGWAFAVRLTCLIGAAAMIARRPSLSAMLYAVAIATLPWSGHAAANEGLLGLVRRINDVIHLFAAALWLGAIAWFAWLTGAARRDPQLAYPLLSAMRRFAPLGIALVAAVASTGIVNAHLIFGLGESASVLATDYGQLLVAKIVLVGLMLVCAARHGAKARNAVRADGAPQAGPNAALAAIRTSLVAELVLALAVIGAVAMLGLLPPMLE